MQVGTRVIRKRLHVRVEHVQPSRCREDFLKRRSDNDAAKHIAKSKGGEQYGRHGQWQALTLHMPWSGMSWPRFPSHIKLITPLLYIIELNSNSLRHSVPAGL